MRKSMFDLLIWVILLHLSPFLHREQLLRCQAYLMFVPDLSLCTFWTLTTLMTILFFSLFPV